jgi:hypothetical protein
MTLNYTALPSLDLLKMYSLSTSLTLSGVNETRDGVEISRRLIDLLGLSTLSSVNSQPILRSCIKQPRMETTANILRHRYQSIEGSTANIDF